MTGTPIIAAPTRRLFGLDFVTDVTIAEIAQRLFDMRDERPNAWRCVITPNVDHLVRYQRVPLEADVADHAGLVLPDGMPIVWGSRLLKRPLSSRLTGADLFHCLWQLLAEHQVPTVVVAPGRDVADRLASTHTSVHCIIPPIFDIRDTRTVDSLVGEIAEVSAAVDARFLIVGVSMPKHHLIASRLRLHWSTHYAGTPTVMLLGQSPEFAVGLVRRAPTWMQRAGLEWMWRLLDDPRRLAKRYLVDDLAFAKIFWREWRRST